MNTGAFDQYNGVLRCQERSWDSKTRQGKAGLLKYGCEVLAMLCGGIVRRRRDRVQLASSFLAIQACRAPMT
jgi:hypothetical protein